MNSRALDAESLTATLGRANKVCCEPTSGLCACANKKFLVAIASEQRDGFGKLALFTLCHSGKKRA